MQTIFQALNKRHKLNQTKIFLSFFSLSVVSFCDLTKGISPKICILCVRVKINKRSFEPFRVWILYTSLIYLFGTGCIIHIVCDIAISGENFYPLEGNVHLRTPVGDHLCAFLQQLHQLHHADVTSDVYEGSSAL